jgi:hypothetical protein
MRMNKKSLSTAILTGSALLLTAGVAVAQSVVNLTALRQTIVTPDGNIVPMWGWQCAASTTTPTNVPCTQTNGVAQAGGTTWQPPLITVPYTVNTTTGASTTGLTIYLTNNLPVPTSLTLVGQIPSGTLSGTVTTPTDTNGPGNPTRESGRLQHSAQTSTTWTTVVSNQLAFTPPTQGQRAQSFVQEAAATTGTITYKWNSLTPGTYLIETGSYPSIQGPMGLYGVLVVTNAPTGSGTTSFVPGTAYPSPAGAVTTTGVPYDADGVLLMSEIDAVQNQAADTAARTTGFSPFKTWSPACSPTGPAGTANTCYPAAVDYTPTYYLINGHSFDRTNPAFSAVNVGSNDSSGTVLLRFVNAGLRMHMPSVYGLQMTLIADDGHLQPDVALALTKGTTLATCPSGNTPIVGGCPKTQNDFFMPAGKVLDIAVKPAGTTAAGYTSSYYPAFDRALSLSTNNERDGGMQAYLVINGGAPTTTAGVTTGFTNVSLTSVTVAVQANPDKFTLPANSLAPFTFNVLANDVGISGAVPFGVPACTAPGQTNCLYPNGMYTYVPTAVNTALTFNYCGNGTTTYAAGPTCATVTVASAALGGGPTGVASKFASKVNTLLNVQEPGVLAVDSDPTGYRLYASICNNTTSAGCTPGSPGTSPANPAIGVAAPANVVDGAAHVTSGACTVTLQSNGSFTAATPANLAGSSCTFQYYAINAQGTASAATSVTLTFPPPSGLNVVVQDATTNVVMGDYKWVIEQDLTFKIDPACQTNASTSTTPLLGSDGKPCPKVATGVPPTLGTNFHTSYMPVIASGCTGPQSCERGQSVYNPVTGTHQPATCNHGVCLPNGTSLPTSLPKDVQLNAFDPDGVTPARYYISILPGDSANPANVGANGYPGPFTQPACEGALTATTATGLTVPVCGHTMSGAPISAPSCTGTAATAGVTCTFPNGTGGLTGGTPLPGSPGYALTIPVQPNPLLTAQLTIFVFEDDAPLNGEHDVGGNNNEPALGGFQVELWDEMAQSGDFTGQMTYDIFNMPLSNALNGTIDPLTGRNACPVGATGPDNSGNLNQVASGMIIVCPQYEDDGVTPSPLAGNALVKNLMPGRFGVIVHPSAAREAAGEVWYQTNTLDGTHFLDSFVKVGEPAYFQEYGPGGYHVFMGMANPAVINARKASFCNGPPAVSCTNTVTGQVSNLHENRAPDETLYDSGVFPIGNPANYRAFAHTTCWASLGDPDGLTFAFTNCDANGNYSFTGIPDGNWSLVVGDQWNDLIVDGSSKPVDVCSGSSCTVKTPNPYLIDSSTFSWQTHVWNSVFMDLNGNGIQDGEPGLIQVPVRIRFRNGRFNNTQFTDVTGHANFNETFPLFNWYVIESDDTRFKNTGVHVVYDYGGQIDGPSGTNCLGAASGGSSNQSNSATNPCGNGNAGSYQGLLNSNERIPVPANLRYPGSYYCQFGDCSELNGTTGFPAAGGPGGSTGRVDPGSVVTEGLQGFLSQTEVLEWGKLPYLPGENGGVRGHVVYSSTRPFDDPTILFQNLWEPLVPNVTINLYQELAQPDGTVGLKLVDTTLTSSWDAYTQGSRSGAGTASAIPNLNCTGQTTADPFFGYTLAGTPQYLYPNTPLPYNSQYKCYDGLHNFNQVQPAPYDGLYLFPSVTNNPVTGAVGTNCTACIANPNAGAPGSAASILPAGKYVVEVVVPPGYELVKEEDKNILIGDAFIASATVSPQFVGLGDIFIVPDQASINQNNINGVYNPAMNSNFANPSYTGPVTGGANPYTNCTTASTTGCPPAGNNGNPTATMGRDQFGGFGPGGLTTLNTPCVGEERIVPDFMSISPESGQVAPFAGATRPLCDRKELVLNDQMQAQTDFFIWTKTPAATHYTGFILDDFSSEFDQSSPSFGEKFAVPNLNVSLKDFNGVEVSRVYSDQWGLYNGLLFSTWEVNPPNPTGYSPGMYITEMNSPGPIFAPACITPPTSTTAGFPLGCVTNQTNPPTIRITDPYYNPGYSTFDYENPFMPGDTTYLDTPVIPLMAFAEAYNPPDCAYPDATPAIASVTAPADTLSLNSASAAGTGTYSGPWVSAAGHSLVISALGDQIVPNYAYSGPSTSTSPFNQRTITRHYGFGAQCTAVSGACTNVSTVTIGGATAPVTAWTDTSITVTVPTLTTAQSSCTFQQSGVATPTLCGQLVVTTGTGQHSIDAVTVTIGGKPPTYIAQEKLTPDTFGSTLPNALQTAIDNAASGDLIIVGPGTYTEMLQMWKPVRLQGVAAATTIINANTQPAGKLDPWRRRLNCLFGLGLSGQEMGATVTTTTATGPASYTTVYDPTGVYSCNFGVITNGSTVEAAVDPIELEPIIGWDSNLNGNLSELLQEPTLMGAYEGAAITVLGKGVENYQFSSTATACGAEGNTSCVVLNNCAGSITTNTTTGAVTCHVPAVTGQALGDCNPASNFYTGNFLCNPARIDGLTLTNSSQGGGALFVHGWNHYLEISNNRMTGNAGTLTGGITLGQPEVPDPTYVTVGSGAGAYMAATPLAIDQYVNMHNNAVTFNSAYGDELNSNTPAAGGGVTVNTGSDYYKFAYNFVCGNLSSGDGGGMTHFGLSFGGNISHNAFLYNQSTNPSLTTNGGGLIIEGNAPDGTLAENSQVDVDLGPSLSDGIGSGMVVDSNLIMGNTAESGEGGGLRLQSINGNDIVNNPSNSAHWYTISVINNIIANNVAGWEGGGVSIQDAVAVDFRNNTVVSNDVTATAGVLFDTLGAQYANTSPPNCNPDTGVGCTNPITTSVPLPAGLVTHPHSLLLSPAFTDPTVTCPNATAAGYTTGTSAANPSDCARVSKPVIANDIIFNNRPFYMTTAGSPSVVVLTPALSQPATPAVTNGVVTGGTGACPTGATHWDIGVYGDNTISGGNPGGYKLNPTYSILTDLTGPAGGYAAGNNLAPPAGGLFTSMYCNGSRVPPEISPTVCTSTANAAGCTYPGALGITVPPGVPDNNPFYANFNLTPAATVDEGNNWINMFYGPLTNVNPTVARGTTGYGTALGSYSPASSSSPAVNVIPVSVSHPALDFFGNPRPDNTSDTYFDIGAVEIGAGAAIASVTPTSLAFGSVPDGTTSTAQTLTLHNTGTASLTGITVVVTAPYSRPAGVAGGTCTATLAAVSTCTINIVFSPTATGAAPGTATITGSAAVTGSPVALTGTGATASTASVTGGPLAFGSVAVSTTSAAQTLTLHNTGTVGLTGITITDTPPFHHVGGSCGPTLAAASTCTITIVYQPTATGAATGTTTITSNLAVTGSPVADSGTGVTGPSTASVTGGPLAFGSVAVGATSAAQTLTLTTGTVGLTGINISDTAPFHHLGGTCGTTLAAASSCTFTVVFQPTAAGAVSGTSTITSNVAINGSPVADSGTGVTGPSTANVTPTSLAFGSVAVGTTSAAQTLTLSNTGTTGMTGITISDTAPFHHLDGTCGTTLAAGSSCTFTVVFQPTATGAASGTTMITSNVAVTGSPVADTGTGVTAASTANVTGGPLAFGSVAVGATSAPLTLTLHNTGTTGLTGVNISDTAPFHHLGGTCGTTLAAGSTCTFTVVFQPTATGAASGTSTITSNVVVSGSPVADSGTGTSTASVTGGPLAFGSVAVGATSAPLTLTLHNTGTTGLTGVNISDTAPFHHLGGTCGTTLAAGSTCTFTVVFQPTATGAASGTSTITSNVAVTGSPVADSGTGTSTASVTGGPLAFGSVAVGATSAPLTLTLHNTGTTGLTGVNISDTAPFHHSGGTCGTTLAAGATCTFTVVFQPTAAGSFTGTSTITSNVAVTGSPVADSGSAP